MTVKNRYQGLQTILQSCGDEGCHFLALCSIIEEVNQRPLDLIEAIRVSQSKGWVKSDFFCKNGDLFLNYFTNKNWKRREVEKLPDEIKENEYTEAIYFNPRTEYCHYRRRGFDTIDNSLTVREGYVMKYYIWYYED